MLIRDLELADEDIRQLKRLLDQDLTANQKFVIETELWRLSGKQAANVSPAQIIDFYCSDTSKWAVLHNLKLKSAGGIERIDHLVISRYFDVIVLNSACFYHDIKISVDGEFKLFDGREYQPIVSPVEKCSRQLDVLAKVFDNEVMAPTRVGVPLSPNLHAAILLSPTQNIIRPPASVLDTRHVIAVNEFIHKLLRHQIRPRRGLSKLGIVARYCTRVTLERIARGLASLHQSACVDFATEFGIDQDVCLEAHSGASSEPEGVRTENTASPQRISPPSDSRPIPESCDRVS